MCHVVKKGVLTLFTPVRAYFLEPNLLFKMSPYWCLEASLFFFSSYSTYGTFVPSGSDRTGRTQWYTVYREQSDTIFLATVSRPHYFATPLQKILSWDIPSPLMILTLKGLPLIIIIIIIIINTLPLPLIAS